MRSTNSFFDWLKERSVWQIALSYVVSSWVVLEVTDTISGVAGLPIWISRLVLSLLAIGLVVVVATALLQRTVRRRGASGRLSAALTWGNVGRGAVGAFALVGVVATLSFVSQRVGPLTPDAIGPRGVHWATDIAIPEILRLTEDGSFLEAYDLAVQAERHVPEDPILDRVWTDIARYTSVRTRPAGATVTIAPYNDPDADGWMLGTTPLSPVRIPVGLFRWRIEQPGYEPVEMVSSGLHFPRADAHEGLELTLSGSRPEDMVLVPGGEIRLGIPGFFDRPPVRVSAYLLDRHEVTNRAFKEFVDAGGYGAREHWPRPIVVEGDTLGFDEAVGRFVDRTGRSAPSTWVAGDYADGEADHPVVGISWYEAAAYADFVGKELPTIYHWHRAAGVDLAAELIPHSNFAGSSLAPVGAFEGVGPYGTRDMAGNAKEWVVNGAGEARYALGGAWDEPSYLFREAEALPAWDRSHRNGVRLMRSLGQPSDVAAGDLTRELGSAQTRSMSDDLWSAFTALYQYDRSDLDPRTEATDTAEDWIRERVSYRAAYGDERVGGLLFRPRSEAGPFQTVVVFPGSGALVGGRAEDWSDPLLDVLVKSGRAVLLPVYKGTYERATGLSDDDPDMTVNYRDHVLMWSKDLARSIDYLGTRSDIRGSNIAYYGVSWGAGIGPVLAAVEPRLSALVLHSGGLWTSETRPEVDQRVTAPRVTIPTLMLNGRFDPFFPLEEAQLPLYHSLGTLDSQKRHVVYDSGHTVPFLQSARETLEWLDRHLGPVR